MDYNVTSEKLTKMTSSNALHTERIGQLEKTLMNEEELHQTAASGLAHQLERERARLNDLSTSSMQTEPDRAEISCQTDFNVPLVRIIVVGNMKYSMHTVLVFPTINKAFLTQCELCMTPW